MPMPVYARAMACMPGMHVSVCLVWMCQSCIEFLRCYVCGLSLYCLFFIFQNSSSSSTEHFSGWPRNRRCYHNCNYRFLCLRIFGQDFREETRLRSWRNAGRSEIRLLHNARGRVPNFLCVLLLSGTHRIRFDQLLLLILLLLSRCIFPLSVLCTGIYGWRNSGQCSS